MHVSTYALLSAADPKTTRKPTPSAAAAALTNARSSHQLDQEEEVALFDNPRVTMLSSFLSSLSGSWSVATTGPLDATSILVKLLTTTLIASAILTTLESRRNHQRRYSVDDGDDSDPLASSLTSSSASSSSSSLAAGAASTTDEFATLQIRWMWDNDHESFLQNLLEGSHTVQASNGRLRLTVSLRPSLFLALPDDDAVQSVVRALQGAPLHEVVFNDSLVQPHGFDRWMQLCHCLGSSMTLSQVKFYIQYGDFRALAGAIQAMRNIAHLSLQDNDEQGDYERFEKTCQAHHVAALAEALRHHPSLQSLTCRLSKAAHDEMLPDVLPVLPTMPALQQVVISENTAALSAGGVGGGIDISAATNSSSFSSLAAMVSNDSAASSSSSSPPEICIANLEFTSQRATERFCQGLANTQTSRIHLDNVLVDAEHLANALGTSHIAHFKLTNWPKQPASLQTFLKTLAKHIAIMQTMETLDLEHVINSEFDRGYDLETLLDFEQAMQQLLHAASCNSSLRVLKLPPIRYTHAMDTAVAQCISKKTSKLQELTLCCPCMPADAKVEYASLLDALHTTTTNYGVAANPLQQPQPEQEPAQQQEPGMRPQGDLIGREPDSAVTCDAASTTSMDASTHQGPSQIPFPRLLKALKSNFTLHHVHFQECHLGCACEEPFDTTSRQLVGIMTRLNRAGRSYLGSPKNHRERGLQLLARVQDDSDCLYWHLRENPLLCQPVVE